MQPFVVNAKPQPVSIDPAKAAVLVVDMQNDFGSKGGMSTEPESISPGYNGLSVLLRAQ